MTVALAVLFIGIAGPGQTAELPPEKASFTADGLVQIGEDRLTFDIFHLGGKERQEMTVDGSFQITILRPDLGIAYLIQPDAGDVLPLPLEEIGLWPRYRLQDGYGVEVRGQEKVGDEPTTIYHVTSSEISPVGMDILVWVTADGIEMRLEGEMEIEGILESVVIERSNIQRAPLDAMLFEPNQALLGAQDKLDPPESADGPDTEADDADESDEAERIDASDDSPVPAEP